MNTNTDYSALLSKYQSERSALLVCKSQVESEIQSLCSDLGLDPTSSTLSESIASLVSSTTEEISSLESQISDLISQFDALNESNRENSPAVL